MEIQSATLVMIPKEEWEGLKTSQQDILQQLKELNTRGPTGIAVKHITAKEFMEAVRIKRTKFDQLVQTSRIKIIRKKRKIYVSVSEIDRYFNDPTVQ